MTDLLVLDAGVLVGWFVSEADGGPKGADKAVWLLEAAARGELQITAPELALAEAANVLWKLHRFRSLPAADVVESVAAILDSPLALQGHGPVLARATALAMARDSSVYDALYVALAERLGAPLVTTDGRLGRKLAAEYRHIVELSSLDAPG